MARRAMTRSCKQHTRAAPVFVHKCVQRFTNYVLFVKWKSEDCIAIRGLLLKAWAKFVWCIAVQVAHPGGEKNTRCRLSLHFVTSWRVSHFFDRFVPLLRSLMLTPTCAVICKLVNFRSSYHLPPSHKLWRVPLVASGLWIRYH